METGTTQGRASGRMSFWVILICLAVGVPLIIGEVGLRAYGLTDPLIYRTDDRFGYEPVPGQTLKRRNRVQSIDEDGFRARLQTADRTRRRVVFLGDSVTYGGTYIATRDTFVEILDRRLEAYGYAAKNGGVNSYSVAQMANRYMHSLESELDEIVVVYFIEGDWHRAPLKMPLPSGPHYLRKPRLAIWEGVKFFAMLKLGITWGAGFVIPANVTGTTERRGKVADLTMDHFLDRNLEAAAALIDFCKSRSRRIVFVHSPTVRLEPLESRIVDFLGERGVDFHDLAPGFAEQSSEAVFVDLAHYSEEGHRAAADLIEDILVPMLGRETGSGARRLDRVARRGAGLGKGGPGNVPRPRARSGCKTDGALLKYSICQVAGCSRTTIHSGLPGRSPKDHTVAQSEHREHVSHPDPAISIPRNITGSIFPVTGARCSVSRSVAGRLPMGSARTLGMAVCSPRI